MGWKTLPACKAQCVSQHAWMPTAAALLLLLQCQAELGPGHINLINVYEAILTPDHLALVMEVAEGGSLTTYVAERWAKAAHGGLILTEDEGRFFFQVSPTASSMQATCSLIAWLCMAGAVYAGHLLVNSPAWHKQYTARQGC